MTHRRSKQPLILVLPLILVRFATYDPIIFLLRLPTLRTESGAGAWYWRVLPV